MCEMNTYEINNCNVIFYPIGDVPETLQTLIDAESNDVPATSAEVRDIYDEQLYYFCKKPKGAYFVAAYKDDVYLGGIGLFLEYGEAFEFDPPAIQGIAKSIARV